jgi:hypothetical protein
MFAGTAALRFASGSLFAVHPQANAIMKHRRRTPPSAPAIEPLEQRHAFDSAGLPVAMWIEGDNGDDTFYKGIVDYATSVQPLASNKLLLRLADPESSDPSISTNFQLTAQSRLIASILQLDRRGFTGQVALIPDFTGGQTWTWNPTGGTFTDANKWEKAYLWADQANDVLKANGSSLLISEVTIEAESSGISADEPTLEAIRDFEKSLWPTMHADPGFVGSGFSHGFTNLAQMATWTVGDPGTRLLDAAYCELYNMYKQVGSGTTYVDAYAASANVTNPSPAAPDTIYTLARNAADPVKEVLGTPSVDDPASTFGYLVGSHTSNNMPSDLSRTYLMFSCEKMGVGGSLIDAFGTWDAPAAGPGAGVDEFVDFCQTFTKDFMPFWNATVQPNICVFQYQLLPATWVNTAAHAVSDTPDSFDDWRFVMWDYRECPTDAASLGSYHTWLLGYLADHPPSKLVLYVTDPDITKNSFYDPTAAATGGATPTNFVGFLKQVGALAANKKVPLEILIDRSSFPAGSTGTADSGWTPLLSGQPSPISLPSDWVNLPRAFSWLSTLLANKEVPQGVITGITIDPELTKGTTGTNVGSVAYQNVACWLDWAKRQAAVTQSLGIGMALEVDSHTLAKMNTTVFPATGDLASLITAGQPITPYLNNQGYPSWRPNDTTPILSMAYMEAYVGNAPPPAQPNQPPQPDRPSPGAYFRWMTDNGGTAGKTPTARTPTAAATDFQRSLLDWPYATGQGTITVSNTGGNHTMTGTGTNFDELQQYAALSSVGADGSLSPSGMPFWKVQDDVPAGTTLSLLGPSIDVSTPSGWKFTELTMDWQAPNVPAGLENRITFMFSAEKGQDLPFFGYWKLPDFLSFMTTASGLLGSTDPTTAIFIDGNEGRGVPLANYGLYSLKQICTAWNIATYPGTPDVIAPSIPQVTLVRDTGISATDRITSDGRLAVTSEPAARVQYSTTGGLRWSSAFHAVPGLNTVWVRQIDAANNISAATVFRFTLDRSPPSAPQVFMARIAGINLYATVTRSAALSVQRVERNTVVEYSVNGRAWSTDYVPVEGRNVVRVRQVDRAGNSSAASRALAFRLETRVAGASARSFSAASAPEVFSLMPTSPSRRPTGRPPIT